MRNTASSDRSLRPAVNGFRDGKELITDGPFAETHEQLGGYFLIEAKNLDEALAIAARIPSAREGTVEVRPIVERTAEAAA